ncbi:hypothetical protein BU52_27565 [Streptomyces toyocaensis]|uniref:Uncharacterized protein n=1 Tax=Streptomyces toyocaensis TaxID=55952 RepID=A0A081XKG6_STRTO|nr:hypothetical protein BU52_27565 [Streptomyces toyocaensis]
MLCGPVCCWHISTYSAAFSRVLTAGEVRGCRTRPSPSGRSPGVAPTTSSIAVWLCDRPASPGPGTSPPVSAPGNTAPPRPESTRGPTKPAEHHPGVARTVRGGTPIDHHRSPVAVRVDGVQDDEPGSGLLDGGGHGLLYSGHHVDRG